MDDDRDVLKDNAFFLKRCEEDEDVSKDYAKIKVLARVTKFGGAGGYTYLVAESLGNRRGYRYKTYAFKTLNDDKKIFLNSFIFYISVHEVSISGGPLDMIKKFISGTVETTPVDDGNPHYDIGRVGYREVNFKYDTWIKPEVKYAILQAELGQIKSVLSKSVKKRFSVEKMYGDYYMLISSMYNLEIAVRDVPFTSEIEFISARKYNSRFRVPGVYEDFIESVKEGDVDTSSSLYESVKENLLLYKVQNYKPWEWVYLVDYETLNLNQNYEIF